MERTEIAEKALDVYAENGERIQEILNELGDLVPEANRPQAEALIGELEHRMFYQDYLCDVHGTVSDADVFEAALIWDYDEFQKTMTVKLMSS